MPRSYPPPPFNRADVLRTLVTTSDGAPARLVDTIECADRWWLVPEWKKFPDQPWRTPVRVIRLDSLSYGPAPAGSLADYVLATVLPIEVFSGTPVEGFEISESPMFLWPDIDPAAH